MEQTLGKRFSAVLRRGMAMAIVACVVVALPAHAFAVDYGATWRSVLFPGAGQAHKGNYKKAVVFAGAALITAGGLFVWQIQYNQEKDKYRDAHASYLLIDDRLAAGEIVRASEIDSTYATMNGAFDKAENRQTWRNVFLTGLVVTYVVNLIDVIISKPYTVEEIEPVSLRVNRDSVLLVKTFRF